MIPLILWDAQKKVVWCTSSKLPKLSTYDAGAVLLSDKLHSAVQWEVHFVIFYLCIRSLNISEFIYEIPRTQDSNNHWYEFQKNEITAFKARQLTKADNSIMN